MIYLRRDFGRRLARPLLPQLSRSLLSGPCGVALRLPGDYDQKRHARLWFEELASGQSASFGEFAPTPDVVEAALTGQLHVI